MMRWLAAASLVFGVACSGGEDCSPVNSSCTPQYETTFANVHQQTLVPSCGVAGSACHAPEGAAAGFVVSDMESTLAALRAEGTQTPGPRIVPGDVCSPLLKRIRGEMSVNVMPPGRPLNETQVCAVQRWVAEGAQP